MSKRTLFLIFSLLVVTLVLLIIAINQPKTPPVTIAPTPTPKDAVAQTVLSFGDRTSTTSSTAALEYSVPVHISTGKNKVTAVQIELQYDPLLLTDVTATAGGFFADPEVLLNRVDPQTGTVSYALGVVSDEKGVSGEGTIINLNFSANSDILQKTSMIFLPKTLVAAEGTDESVLKDTIVGQFNVGIEESSPSASPISE